MSRTTLVSEARLDGLNDPAAGEKLKAAFLDFAKQLKHAPRPAIAQSQREVTNRLDDALYHLHTYAASAIASGLLWQGVGDTVRVEVSSDAPNTATVNVFGLAVNGDGESLFGEIRQSATQPTATGGVTYNFSVHLTPIGSQPLWDFGDVVNAAVTEDQRSEAGDSEN